MSIQLQSVPSTLTAAQRAALEAAMRAVPAWAEYVANGQTDLLASRMNQPADPAWIVWKEVMTPEEARLAIVQAAIQLDGLTAAKRDALLWVVAGPLDVSDAAVRAGISDLCGAQATLKASLTAAQKRNATWAEQVLSTGTGSDASPATLTWYGAVTGTDVVAMLSL